MARTPSLVLDAGDGTDPTPELSRADRMTIRLLGGISALITTALFLVHLLAGLRLLAAGETSIRLLTRAELPNLGTPGGPGIVSAGFDSAHVIATGLSSGTRGLLGSATLIEALTIAAVGGSIAWFLLLVAARRPFERSLFTTTLIAGMALLLGPILAIGLSGLAQMQAAAQLNPVAHDVFIEGFELNLLSMTVPGIGLTVLALAFVFRIGVRLKRDTEGLV